MLIHWPGLSYGCHFHVSSFVCLLVEPVCFAWLIFFILTSQFLIWMPRILFCYRVPCSIVFWYCVSKFDCTYLQLSIKIITLHKQEVQHELRMLSRVSGTSSASSSSSSFTRRYATPRDIMVLSTSVTSTAQRKLASWLGESHYGSSMIELGSY